MYFCHCSRYESDLSARYMDCRRRCDSTECLLCQQRHQTLHFDFHSFFHAKATKISTNNATIKSPLCYQQHHIFLKNLLAFASKMLLPHFEGCSKVQSSFALKKEGFEKSLSLMMALHQSQDGLMTSWAGTWALEQLALRVFSWGQIGWLSIWRCIATCIHLFSNHLLGDTFPQEQPSLLCDMLCTVGFLNVRLPGCSVGGRLGDCQFEDVSLHVLYCISLLDCWKFSFTKFH